MSGLLSPHQPVDCFPRGLSSLLATPTTEQPLVAIGNSTWRSDTLRFAAERLPGIKTPGPVGFRCGNRRANVPLLFGPARGVHALPEDLAAHSGVGVVSDGERA